MAENCKHLKFLTLSLLEAKCGHFDKVLKEYKAWKTPAFEKLIELKLQTIFLLPTDFFFKYFKAPNLKTVAFDLISTSDFEETYEMFAPNMRKVIKLLKRSLPGAEITLVKNNLQETMMKGRFDMYYGRRWFRNYLKK